MVNWPEQLERKRTKFGPPTASSSIDTAAQVEQAAGAGKAPTLVSLLIEAASAREMHHVKLVLGIKTRHELLPILYHCSFSQHSTLIPNEICHGLCQWVIIIQTWRDRAQ